MADREDQSNLPPIPDGGLAETMPDWLRRPPAWRSLPDREVTVPEPAEAAALPEPDDSVIDPRTFLTDDDLPAWLRTLGPGRGAAAERAPDAADVQYPLPDAAAGEPDALRTDVPRFTPASPPLPASAPAAGERKGADRSQPKPALAAGRQGSGLVTLLAALLLVAIVVIGILLVV